MPTVCKWENIGLKRFYIRFLDSYSYVYRRPKDCIDSYLHLGSYSNRIDALRLEVLSVPHVFRAESVGTARIPIGNSGTQYHPNSREFVKPVQLDSDRKGQFRSDHSELFPTGFRSEPSGSKRFRSEIIPINH